MSYGTSVGGRDAAWQAGRAAGIEEAAKVIDDCNREGPFQAIGAAARIRALVAPSTGTDPCCYCEDATIPHRRSVCEAMRVQRQHEQAPTALKPLAAPHDEMRGT